MGKILLIETSTKTCSVGVCEAGELIAVKEHTAENYTHAEVLHVYIKEMLAQAKLNWQDLNAVCVSKGPGSYTGLRIGVSAAKGFCMGADLRLLSVTSLQSLAVVGQRESPDYDYYIPMMDARRMEVYTQVFDGEGKPCSNVEAKVLETGSYGSWLDQGSCLFYGDGAAKWQSEITHRNAHFANITPSVKGMVKLACNQFDHQQFEDAAYFEPFYLKDFVAGKKG